MAQDYSILSCTHCCNLLKVREAIYMEMRQGDLTLQNWTRIYFSCFPLKTAEIFHHQHSAATINSQGIPPQMVLMPQNMGK